MHIIMLGTKWSIILSQRLVHIEAWRFHGFHSHTDCNTVSAFDSRSKKWSLHAWVEFPFPVYILRYCTSNALCVNGINWGCHELEDNGLKGVTSKANNVISNYNEFRLYINKIQYDRLTGQMTNTSVEQHIKRATYESNHVCNQYIIWPVGGIEGHWNINGMGMDAHWK